jgi:kumamolisin
MSDQRIPVPGSEDKLRAGERWSTDATPAQPITASILLRRHSGAPSGEDLLSGHYQAPSREAAEASLRADPGDIKAVTDFLQQQGLKVLDEDAAARRIRVEGSAAAIDSAFGVRIRWAEDAKGHRFLTYEGSISVPKQLSGIITAVLGLSTRSVAQHHQ